MGIGREVKLVYEKEQCGRVMILLTIGYSFVTLGAVLPTGFPRRLRKCGSVLV